MNKSLVVCLLAIASSLARASECRTVGGTISTNFVDATTTFGTATGDLDGAIGVSVRSVTPGPNGTLIFHNQHTWVTTTGDTINTDAADATASPSGLAGLYAVSYLNGIEITGGTGRFAKASGKIRGWGSINQTENQIVLHYEGKVCFADRD